MEATITKEVLQEHLDSRSATIMIKFKANSADQVDIIYEKCDTGIALDVKGNPGNLLTLHIQKIRELYPDLGEVRSKTEREYYKELSVTVYITLRATYAKVVKELILLWLHKLWKTPIAGLPQTWRYRITDKYHPLLFNARKEDSEGNLIVQMKRDNPSKGNTGRRNNRNTNKGGRRKGRGNNRNKGRGRPQQRGPKRRKGRNPNRMQDY